MAKLSLKEQAEAIKRMAEESGLESNYFFITTFERYEVQLSILERLKESMDKDGMLVSKEYVKGRGNLYSSPAVTEFNRTTDSANKTVSTLMRILKNFGASSTDDKGGDPLLAMINGGDGDDDGDNL
ncbi:MAG: hypothetical protein IJ426_00130 [Clostridia bacterium]|nr:hypothetical protein [Clostridia bacterium]